VAYANVENSLEESLHRSEIVKEMFEPGEIGIVGGIYNIETGQVDFFKNLTKRKKEEKKQKKLDRAAAQSPASDATTPPAEST
jgi:carbonic anhydrase